MRISKEKTEEVVAGFSESQLRTSPERTETLIEELQVASIEYPNPHDVRVVISVELRNRLVTALSAGLAQCQQQPQTLGGMIAAIYGELDAEDCNKIDRAWIEWRGRGTITYALSSTDRPVGMDWEVSEETKRHIDKIERNIREAPQNIARLQSSTDREGK